MICRTRRIAGYPNAGISVPEDISLIGVDNIDITAHTYPPMTTAPPKAHMGSTAMRMINACIRVTHIPNEGYIENRSSAHPAIFHRAGPRKQME